MAQELIDKIRAAAQAKGIDPEVALGIARAESGLDPNAKAKSSTAAGLFQILNNTWSGNKGAPGKQFDPDENIRVGTDIISKNVQSLRSYLGRNPSPKEVYAAHYFGASGARDFLSAAPDTPTSKIFSEKVLAANPNLKNKTAAQVLAQLEGKLKIPASNVSRETKQAQTEPTPAEEMMTKALPAGTTASVSRETMMKGMPDVKSMPASYQAAFALAALADAQDEEDDKAFDENKGTETERFFAEHKPVNHLASLDLSVAPITMADGGDVTARQDEPLFDAASRTFVDVMTGRRTPITEKDFTAREQLAMMDAIKRSQARGGQGRVGYEDYPTGDQIGPGYVDIRNTLGGFQYKQMPDGSTVISDRYDFHGPRVKEYEKMGTGEKVVKSAANALSEFVKNGFSPRDLAGELGRAWIGSQGPEVSIRIPPVKRAEGSPEEGERLTPQQIERLAAESNQPYIGNPNVQKQGEAARRLAAMRDVNTLPDPKTYAVMQGLLGTAPDQMGFSVMHPKLAEIKEVAEPAFAVGTALQVAPALKALGLGKVPGMVGEELNRRLLAGESLTPGLNTPAPINFIRRPAGGVFPTAKGPDEAPASALDIATQKTLETLDFVEATPEAKEATKQFFNTKMHDYFKTKASSVSDPVREALINGRIKIPKDTPLEEQFPQSLLNAARAGDVTAMRDIENRFDKMMGVKSYRVKQAGEGYEGSEAAQEGFNQTILQQMKANPSVIPDEFLLRLAKKDTSKLSKQEQAAEVATIRQKLADNPTLFTTIFEPKIARLLGERSVESVSPEFVAKNPEYYTALSNAKDRKEGIMALQADVPITDLESRHRLPDMFGMDYSSMVEQAAKMDPKELSRMSVPEFFAKAVPAIAREKDFERKAERVESLVKAGKPVPKDIAQYGTKEFLPTDQNGMTWREIVDPQGAIVQSKFLGNSIAGYAKPGTYGALNKGSTALKNGEVRLFGLYDKDGNVVTNVEFVTPKVANDPDFGRKANTITQMYGNGVRTANVTPENYPAQMLDLVNALQPKNIPPSIKELFYNNGLTVSTPEPPLNAARAIQVNMFQPPAQRATGGMIERQTTDNRRYL